MDKRETLKKLLVAEFLVDAPSKEAADDAARRVERSCLNASILRCKPQGISCTFDSSPEFVRVYSEYCRRMLYNVSYFGSSASLRARIYADKKYAENVASLTDIELLPQETEALRDEIERRKGVVLEEKVSTRHTCPKCGCKRTKRQEYQGTASDEISKFLIICVECAWLWRGG